MTDMKKIAGDWISLTRIGRGHPDREKFIYANREMEEFLWSDPESAWSLIMEIFENTDDGVIIENLSAGPLETLMARYGDRFIDRLEGLTGDRAKIKDMLSCLWKNDIPDPVWARLQLAIGRLGRP